MYSSVTILRAILTVMASLRFIAATSEHVIKWHEYLYVEGKSLSPGKAFYSKLFARKCECRIACSVHPRCKSFSGTALQEGLYECHLSDKYVMDNVLVKEPNSFFAVRKDEIFSRGFFGADNLLYVALVDKKDFREARKACSKLSGFRMVTPKFGYQMAVLESITRVFDIETRKFYLDISREKEDSEYLFGYGKPVKNTEIFDYLHIGKKDDGRMILYEEGRLMNRKGKDLLHPMCQANPFDIRW